ncbi:hypothetical protein [Candidatus Neptunochlamydia vexilliferae]|uniref:Uncharacterized protein n=1 Tax=Candidatus Neptunichlamydia vexilliferae TaxID=1651774 RepID=A0ABS0AZX3_9BACT|nr:hypothetical protein [Candidatus Neptunochlamydia vexilliferae]MBF5058885.1 hypothetical protein [Candidatus Neptunochlamydia vexilliferae]
MTVGAPKAFLNYFSSVSNTVSILNTADFGVSKFFECPTLKKIGGMVPHFFTFLSIGGAGSTLYMLASDWAILNTIRKKENNNNADTKGKHFPRQDAWVGPKGWISYRTLRHAAKLFALGVGIHQGLRALSVVSSSPCTLAKRVAPFAGMVAAGLDIAELQKQKNDQAGRLKNSDQKELAAYTINATVNQLEHGLMIAVKIASLAAAFKAWESCEGLCGDAIKFVNKHSVNIYGALFASHLAINLVRNVACREVIKKDKEAKQKEKSNHPFAKYVFNVFPGSRSFVRLAKLVFSGLVEYYDSSFGKALGMSKHFDALFYIPKVVTSLTEEDEKKGVVAAYGKWDSSKKVESLQVVAIPTFEFVANTAGVAKWVLQLAGYKGLARYAGYVKGAMSVSAATGHIVIAVNAINANKDKKLEEVQNQAQPLAARTFAVIANSIAMMETYAGPAIKQQQGQMLPPWFKLALAGAAWTVNERNSLHKAWTAKVA